MSFLDDYDDFDSAMFVGPCTCNHDMIDHGWLECDIQDCSCEAHWEE